MLINNYNQDLNVPACPFGDFTSILKFHSINLSTISKVRSRLDVALFLPPLRKKSE